MAFMSFIFYFFFLVLLKHLFIIDDTNWSVIPSDKTNKSHAWQQSPHPSIAVPVSFTALNSKDLRYLSDAATAPVLS